MPASLTQSGAFRPGRRAMMPRGFVSVFIPECSGCFAYPVRVRRTRWTHDDGTPVALCADCWRDARSSTPTPTLTTTGQEN